MNSQSGVPIPGSGAGGYAVGPTQPTWKNRKQWIAELQLEKASERLRQRDEYRDRFRLHRKAGACLVVRKR